MPNWKKNLFVRVIKSRMDIEKRTKEEVILEYPALTVEEQTEILSAI